MRGTQPRLRRLVGAAALSCTSVFVALSFASLPAGAETAATTTGIATTPSCPVLSVANPNPGDNVTSGGYVISGAAFDPAASSGSGVSRVDVFLGARDEGGMFLGSAVPGSTGDDPRAFSLEVTLPSNFNAETDFAAYAQSSVTGASTSITFPIFVGQQPRTTGLVTPTPVPSGKTITNHCPEATGQTTAAPAPAAPAVAATPAAAVSAPATGATNACPTLSLGNPGPGDLLMPGGLFISGVASVPGATNGSGVSRVDLFLGERDQGGTFLGSGIPGTDPSGIPNAFTVQVTVPNLSRGVDFAAYAIGTNGQEQSIVFPVLVGPEPTRTAVGPTPTPIPMTSVVSSTCK